MLRHGGPGRNENDERIIGLCVEQAMVVGNTLVNKPLKSYKKKIIQDKVRRDCEGMLIVMMDYVDVPRNRVGRLSDVEIS